MTLVIVCLDQCRTRSASGIEDEIVFFGLILNHPSVTHPLTHGKMFLPFIWMVVPPPSMVRVIFSGRVSKLTKVIFLEIKIVLSMEIGGNVGSNQIDLLIGW